MKRRRRNGNVRRYEMAVYNQPSMTNNVKMANEVVILCI